MRMVIQRVAQASVSVGGEEKARIGGGYLALVGVARGDSEQDALYMAQKVQKLRVFEDEQGKMNLSIAQTGGEVLAVSQFTLLGDARGQNRPGFTQAEEPERANKLYICFCEALEALGVRVQRGVFRADMQVLLVNDGPVTILLDSRKAF